MKEDPFVISIKKYYITVLLIILTMVVGIGILNPRFGDEDGDIGYITHFVLVIILSTQLLIYPKYKTSLFRLSIVVVAMALFYLLFFLYPDTGTTIILISFIPAISILFYDIKLFYFSILLNTILLALSISSIYIMNLERLYAYLTDDLIGNIAIIIGSQILLAFSFNITSIRIKQHQLFYEQLKNSERLKTTGELAAAVAHEIRNPLTVVKGYLQLYEQDPTLDSQKKNNFKLLIEELDNTEKVITELLSLSKPSSKESKPEKVDVKMVIKNVTDLLQSYGLLTKNNIEVIVEDDCSIAICKMELNQLLVNIIKNAIEASIFGDSIIVSAKKNKGMVENKVIDQGEGMSSEELEYIGTPFYSLKSKGTGLGLMICHKIVANHNGTINYESTKGKGTTVTICFPFNN